MAKEVCRGKEGIAKILAYRSDNRNNENISPNEDFHPGYGCTVTKLTKEDIANLLAGEPIWFDDGEYSHILIAESPQPCKDCGGSGIIETGNNALPCRCPAGDTALFNDAFLGLVTGATIKAQNR